MADGSVASSTVVLLFLYLDFSRQWQQEQEQRREIEGFHPKRHDGGGPLLPTYF
jgi:hypothetical protein